MPEHDPLKFAAELSAKLATRSRHVCVFLGAGASRACGLPDIAQLQERVLLALGEEKRVALTNQLAGRNLEEALSRLRRIAALITGDQTVDGLTGTQAKELDAAVCQEIVKELDIEKADLTPVLRLAAWAARAGYRLPIEFFTVNYDLLLETALERLGVPYFDGFVGNLRARFHTDLVESVPGSGGQSVPAFFVRLWKLHGSVNWAWDNERQVVRLGQPVAAGRVAAIYPSDTKYEESRRVPFVVLQDRLRRALHQPESLVMIAGYSFGDAHLNEMIFDAAARRERSEFVVFCYSHIPEALSGRASTTPNLQVVSGREAIIGGMRAAWKSPEDAPVDLWENNQLALRDFGKLASYLARSATRDTEAETTLRELIEVAFASRSSATDGKVDG
ncbi:SIR2 family protein [Mesorhizobium sp. B2-5-12]|nr:SIR2 family protein [Mesorhizobium sp. B2-5-12]TPK21844.1 SIR2 family protein [Mesorhizobium sp. B2-5-6]